MTSPLGTSVAYAYDTAGNLIRATDARGGVKSYTVNERGYRIRTTDELNHEINYVVDTSGNVLEQSMMVTGPTGPRLQTVSHTYDREGRAVMQSLEQFRCNELCRIGDAGFGFFLSNNRAPTGTLVGTNARPFKAASLKVAQVSGGWAVCDDNRTLAVIGDRADDARAALAAIQHYGFDSLCPIGGGKMGGYHLFVKMR